MDNSLLFLEKGCNLTGSQKAVWGETLKRDKRQEAEASFMAGDFPGAARLLQEILSGNPGGIGSLYNLGIRYRN